jgi:hypothetical protein
MVATTTEDAQTVTIDRLQAANAYEIDWGDGSVPQAVAAEYSGTLTHEYASAGAYNVVIPQAAGYTDIDIRDSQIGMTVTAANPFPSVTGSVTLDSLPNLTWTVSTDTPFPSVTGSINLLFLPNLTWTVTAANPFPSVTRSINLFFLPNLTWTVTAANPFPSVTGSINLYDMPNLTWGSGAATNLHSVGAITYESSLSQPAVDAVLADLYSVFPARTKVGTIDLLGGGNAAPSGTLQAACPPTTGKEYAYELVNDSCGVSDFHWISVSIQA